MRSARWTTIATAAALSLSLSACSHFKKSSKPEVVSIGDTAPRPGGEAVSGEGVPVGDGTTLVSKEGAGATHCLAHSECGPGQRCEGGACVADVDVDACSVLPTVYFPFDESQVQEDEAARQLARCLRGSRAPSVAIEGFADERGAADYNVALSYKRAQSLRRTLVQEGVSIPMNVVAWGEAFPADPGHDEDAWAQNRRAIATPAGQLLADGRDRAAK